MTNTIEYIADDTGNKVVLDSEQPESNPLAELERIRFAKSFLNVQGYLKDDKGQLLGLTVKETFDVDDMPEGWLYDEKDNKVIVPNLKTEEGQSACERFNRIAQMDIPVKAGGFTPNAGDMTKNTTTTTTRPTGTGRGDNPALKKT